MSVRDIALNATLATKIIEVPEWDAKVQIRAFSAADRERFVTSREPGYLYTDVVIACTLDPDSGAPIFDQADRDKLKDSPAGPLERIFSAVADMSLVSDDAVDKAKEGLKGDPFDGSS